ncbi:sensor histidine kinase [Paenibacillus chungangensis]
MVKKMIAGYFCIIFIPVLVFGFWLYNTSYQSLAEQYMRGKQQVLEQSYGNLKVQLAQLEAAYGLFQYNGNVTEYLSGAHNSEAEYVYAFLKYISPISSHLSIGNPHLKEIVLYANQPHVLVIEPDVTGIAEFPLPELRERIKRLPPDEGLWHLDMRDESMALDLRFIQKLYNKEFSKDIGLLEIRVDSSMLSSFIQGLSGSSDAVMQKTGERSIALAEAATLAAMREGALSDDLWNQELYVEELDLNLVIADSGSELFTDIRKKKNTSVIVIALLLLVLSYLYYMFASSVTRRISRLARHMKRIDHTNLEPFPIQPGGRDEVYYLTTSFNLMMNRIDELINKVQRSEIMRKEAEYMMLQAQIKPHFLYNTLETIRMLAEADGNASVSQLTNSFARFIRYSLARHEDEVALADELEHVADYLRIHRTRFGERMTFDIEIEDKAIRKHRCPRFILQPIVENSIVHGISKQRRRGHIAIRCVMEEGRVAVRIRDDGAGMSEEALSRLRRRLNGEAGLTEASPSGGGLGLWNVHERIGMYYGENSGIALESAPGEGTVVVLTL